MNPPPEQPDEESRARTHLANERTFLAWFRTGITLIALGLAGAQFLNLEQDTGIPVVQLLATVLVVAGIALLLLIGYAFSWVFALIGLSSSSPEASNAYGFTILFPLTFVSSAFVPVASMPSWLQPIAEHNPFTTMVDAARALFLGVPAGNDVWLALLWTLAIIAVFAPLSAWRYRRVVAR